MIVFFVILLLVSFYFWFLSWLFPPEPPFVCLFAKAISDAIERDKQ